MVLGDSFPDNKKRYYFYLLLVPGMILRLFCPFTSPPKYKFILLLSMNPEPVFFIINTKPNRFVLRKFPDQQIPVIQRDYTSPTHDSYIECSTPRSEFTAEAMRAKGLADLGRIKGMLTEADRAAVVGAIKRNRTIETSQKRRLIKNFQAG